MIRLMASRRGKINRPLRQVKAAVTQARQSARLESGQIQSDASQE
jgi:hypothetical protein